MKMEVLEEACVKDYSKVGGRRVETAESTTEVVQHVLLNALSL